MMGFDFRAKVRRRTMTIRSGGASLVMILAALLMTATPAAAQDLPCCFLEGGCEIQSVSDCFNQGGVWLSQGTCDDCAVFTGACCLPIGCDFINEIEVNACFIIGGDFIGFGTTCADCPNPCPPDLNRDLSVGFADLQMLLQAWGPCVGECPGDLNGDGSVGFADLQELLQAWGPCPF